MISVTFIKRLLTEVGDCGKIIHKGQLTRRFYQKFYITDVQIEVALGNMLTF